MTLRSDGWFWIFLSVVVIAVSFETEVRGALNRIGAPALACAPSPTKD